MLKRLSLIFLIVLVHNPLFSVASELVVSNKIFTAPENYGGKLSPDGKYFSFIKTEDGEDGLEFVELSNFKVTRAIELDSQLSLDSYQWLSNDVLLLQVSEMTQRVQYIVTLYEKDRTQDKILRSKFQQLKNGYVVSVLNNGKDELFFSSIDSKRDDKRQTLYKINVTQLKANNFKDAELIEQSPDNLLIYSYDKNSEMLLGIFYNESDAKVNINYKPLGQSNWTRLFGFNDKDFTMKPVGFINENTFAVLSNDGADKVGLYEFDIPTQKIGKLIFEHETFDLVDASLTEDGNLQSIEYIENGLLRTDWKSSISQKIANQFKEALKGSSTQIISKSADEKYLLVYESGPNNAGKYYIYNNEIKELSHLVSHYPELDKSLHPKHTVLKVQSDDGVEIEAYLTQPNSIDHNTLLVMPHGGPIGIRDYNTFNRKVQYFANRGFTILRVNFRGSSGFGKSFIEQGVGEFGKQIEADISSVVDHLLARQIFKNVCSIGASYGAYSSLMLAIENPQLYSCVIASYGVYDLPLLFNVSNYRSGEEFEQYIGKTVGENTQEKRDYSPFYRAAEINTPLLLIAGKQDDIAEFEQTNRLRYVLEKLGKEFDYLFYEQVGHGQRSYYGQAQENAYIVEFLLNTLNLDWPTDINDDDRKALAKDYENIADVFLSEDIVKKENSQFTYYKRASELGNGRASFNLASMYQQGKGVEKDMDRAFELYEKSAKQGFDSAHIRLYHLYLKEGILALSPEKALQHMQQLLEKDPEDIAVQLDLAKLYCTTDEPIGNTDRCIALLKEWGPIAAKKNAEQKLYYTVTKSIIHGNFTDSQSIDFANLAIDMLKIDHPKYELDIKQEGIFYEKRSSKGWVSIKQADEDTVKEALEQEYESISVGVEFQPDHPGLSANDEFVLALSVLEIFNADGELTNYIYHYGKHTGRDRVGFYYGIDEDEPNNTYVMSIYDIYGELKYQKRF